MRDSGGDGGSGEYFTTELAEGTENNTWLTPLLGVGTETARTSACTDPEGASLAGLSVVLTKGF